ncbi:hypothetical protein A2U01_0069277, partial [Trifolium medium]|nr:hypothetical protein [Trifolium medium]
PGQQHQAPTHPAGPAMDLTLQNWFYHTWDQNAANFRAMTAIHESMYQLHLQGPIMTPQDFQAHSNWPGDRPHFGEGMGADDDEEDDASD